MLDGLLEMDYRVHVNAGDDAHFGHPDDRFGGWVEGNSTRRRCSNSTQGPTLRELLKDGDHLYVQTSEAYAITLTGSGDRWLSRSYCRITAVDPAGRRAWSTPIWP